jgi:plasmid maintenance system antidote protein VapI
MPDLIMPTDFKSRRKTKKTVEYDHPTKPPTHPGIILFRTIMPQKGVDTQTLSQSSGISVDDLERLFRGELDIDRTVKNKLSTVFKSGANMLREQQIAYDHYLAYGKWPPPVGPVRGPK